nr:hypothetical protein [Tanacetum cinerariifolium]
MMELQDLSLARETQLVVVVKLQEIDKHFVELMVVREFLEADTICNEKVLYKIMNVVEMDNTVEKLVMTVVDNEWDLVKNAIALFKLAIGSHLIEMMELQDLSLARETQLVVVVKLQEIDKHFVELMVVREFLEADTICNEKVLYKIMNVVEMDNTVEKLVMTVVDNEWDCT